MRLKKLLFLFNVTVVSITLNTISASAQETSWIESVRAELQEMFSTLDKTKVPTGYLSDYSVNMVDFAAFDGLSLVDSNYVDLQTFADMMFSLNSARVSSSTDSLDVDGIVQTLKAGPDTLKLGLLAYNYNYIVANALTDQLISFSNNKVYDVYENGIWKNPYDLSTLFGFTTGMADFVWTDPIVVFPSSTFLDDIGISALYYDAGDGLGYRSIQPGSTQYFYYSTAGPKELKMKAVLSGGTYLEGHSLINVKNRPIAPSGYYNVDSLLVSPVVWEGNTYHAKVTYILASGHTGIEKPFIFSEGFDPWKLENAFGNNVNSSGWNTIVGKREKLLSVLSGSGYDFVYIDWTDYWADIRANGELFRNIIDQINNEKAANGSSERNVVLGESMGGVIACYALRKMEIDGVPHETDYFISNDVPYLGANVPLGAQYMLQELIHIYNSIPKLFQPITDMLLPLEKINAILELPEAKSVNQLLYGVIKINGSEVSFWTGDHYTIENTIRTNGFPQGDTGYPLENIVLCEGGYFNTPTGPRSYLFDPGDKILHLNASAQTTLLTEIAWHIALNLMGIPNFKLLGRHNLKTSVDIYPYKYFSQKLAEYNIWYTKKFLWASRTYNLRSRTYYGPSSGVLYDNIPGSYYSTNQIDLPDPQLNYNIGILKAGFDYTIADRFMFVPTASALFTTDYGRNYYSSPPTPLVDTPFQSMALADISRFHTDIDTTFYKSFLENVLSARILGPFYAVTGCTYTLTGYNDSVPISWSTSDSGVATMGNNGVITVAADTAKVINVIAQGSAFGKTYYKKQQVLAGLPNQYLTFSLASGTYTIQSHCVYQNQLDPLTAAVQNGDIYYKWGVKFDDASIYWYSPGTASSFSVTPSTTTTLTNVYLKLVDRYNNESSAISVTVQKPDPLLVNIKRVGKWEGQNNYYYSFNFSDISNYSSGKVRLVLKKNPQSGEIVFPHFPAYYSFDGRLQPNVETIVSTETYQGGLYFTFNFENSFTLMGQIGILVGSMDPLLGETRYLILDVYTVDDELIQTLAIPIVYEAVYFQH